jgi:hypothetical protein
MSPHYKVRQILKWKTFMNKVVIRIFFFFIQLTLPYLLSGQTAPIIIGQKCFGGSLSEDSTGTISSKSIIQTSDRGYIIVGGTNSKNGNVSENHGLDDVWVVKINSLGIVEWQKCFGGSGTEEADCIIQTKDKGYAICGWTNSNDGDVFGYHGGFADAWVLKIDSLGNIQWQKCLGGTDRDEANSIIQTSDGGYAVAGFTASTNIVEGFINHGGTGDDAYIIKLDSIGTVIWQKCYGGTGQEAAGSIIQTADGGFIFDGSTDSYNGDVSGNHGDSTVYGISADFWVVQLDPFGRIIKQKCFGGSASEYATCIIRTNDNGYILTGQTSSKDGDVSGYHLGIHPHAHDVWVIKVDSSFNILWQKCLGGSKDEAGFSIILTNDGGYAITGITNSNDGDVSGKHGGISDSTDIWVVKIDSVGTIEWQKCLGGTGREYGYAIIQTADSGYAIYGRTESNDGDVSGNHGSADIWIVKLGGTAKFSVNSSSGQSNFSWVYPNPSNDLAHLYLFQSQPIKQIQFYNLFGNQYFPEYQIENNLLSIDEHNLPTGSFMVRVSYLNTETEEVRKFLHFH